MITFETALLTALSAVTTGLVWAVQQLYARLVKAEKEVEELRDEVAKLEHENGRSSAMVEIFRRCPQRNACPFYNNEPVITR